MVKITRTPIDFYFSLIPTLALKSRGQKFHFSITLLKFNIIRFKFTYLSFGSMGFYTLKLVFSCIFMCTDMAGKQIQISLWWNIQSKSKEHNYFDVLFVATTKRKSFQQFLLLLTLTQLPSLASHFSSLWSLQCFEKKNGVLLGWLI